MKQKNLQTYHAPQTTVLLMETVAPLAVSGDPAVSSDGKTISTTNVQPDGDAGMAASRGTGQWDDD